jgi:hypothetical protein
MTVSKNENNGIKTEERKRKENVLFIVLTGLFLFACLLTCIKRILTGYDLDEQYAVTLAYRIISGDILIKEMWEPHMFSGLFTAIPVWIYLQIRGNADYLVIFLRIFGLLIQGLVTLCWFTVMKDKTNRFGALFSAAGIFFVLPKLIQSPEFANMEIWFLILTGLLILAAQKREKAIYYMAAGVSFLIVMCAYPSCILLLPLYLVVIAKKKNMAWFLLPSIVFGLGTLLYLLLFVGAGNLLPNVKHILSDGSHAGGFASKILGYLGEMPALLLHLVIYALIGALISALIVLMGNMVPGPEKKETRIKFKSKEYLYLSLAFFVIAAFLDQLRFWLVLRVPNVHPQYRFAALFLAGIILFAMMEKEQRKKWKDSFLLFAVASFIGFAAILALTNLDIKATLVHLLPGCLLCLAFAGEVYDAFRGNKALRVVVTIAIFSTILVNYFGINWLIRINNEGAHEDLHYGKKLSVSGPAKGIYCGYLDGMESNSNYELFTENIPEGARLLYVGPNSTFYLYHNYEICEPSVISTPTYDRGAIEYYEMNPQKSADYIVLEKWYIEYEKYVSGEYLEWVDEQFDMEHAIESDYVILAKKR